VIVSSPRPPLIWLYIVAVSSLYQLRPSLFYTQVLVHVDVFQDTEFPGSWRLTLPLAVHTDGIFLQVTEQTM